MRIALLSNVTIEVLAGMLKPAHDVWLAPGFGGWMETSLAVPDDLKTFDPEAVFLLLDFHLFPPPPQFSASLESAIAALESALPNATVIVPDLEDLFSPTENVDSSTVDLDLLSRPDSHYDTRMWRLASMPWSLTGLRAIRDEIERLLGLMKGGRRKALALDFDNTLWQGVVGEDGVDAIRPNVEFQRGVRELRERGVLLVGLSKNNESDVAPVWDDPRMVLGRDDFAEVRIDWREKSENLEAVARALNLGTDAFVFVDDDPAERALMKARHPEVAVPDGPISARRLARLYFPRMRLTDEDRAKTEQYRAEAKRREAAEGLSLEDYLKGLEIRTEIHPIAASEFVRVAQLSQKSNQFNVCTNRYTVDDIARFASDRSHLVLTARVADRFGDLGLVAFVHAAEMRDGAVKPSGHRWEILDWVMSCRAMNRRIEFTLQNAVEDALRERGATEVCATWRQSARNEPVRELFERFGFAVLNVSNETKSYIKPL